MTTETKIQWTDHTFNPWWGCTKVHAGCKNCYAEATDKRWGGDHWGNGPRRMVLGEWGKPAKWNAEAQKSGVMRRVFCASMCDIFEDYDGTVVDQQGKLVKRPGECENWSIGSLRLRVFDIIEQTKYLEWQLLTKRPENVMRMVPKNWLTEWPRNVITGTSPCDQETADECVPRLLAVPGRHFLSCEPLLGPIELCMAVIKRRIGDPQPDWVIVGGESGRGARPCYVKWIRQIRDDCARASVPCFIKQLGSCPVETGLFLKDNKGGDWYEWPEDLRVRQFPAELYQ